MRHFFIRFQLVFVSIILLATFIMLMAIAKRNNHRWDLTREGIYSLSPTTVNLLQQMRDDRIEIIAFYPDDIEREDFEIFLNEAQLHHRDLDFQFYDPNRSPQFAKEKRVRQLYTTLIRYRNREERLVHPEEEGFANALLRLMQPRVTPLCFVTGHGEAALRSEEDVGLNQFREVLEEKNYTLHEILLERDQIPAYCEVLLAMGPQQDWSSADLNLLREAFDLGRSALFLVDPMDPGTGASFKEFLKSFGVRLGSDVIVDKMSRMVGGDFLVPFVNEYNTVHALTADLDIPTFFPVVRSVYPASKAPEGTIVVPIAFSGSGSWAETNLAALEKGEAAFESESDFSGPITLAVAVEAFPTQESSEEDPAAPQQGGRMVVIGDSDFLKNAYIEVSGNQDLGLRIIDWLARDERHVEVEELNVDFQPMPLTPFQRLVVVSSTLILIPTIFFLVGSISIILRKRKV